MAAAGLIEWGRKPAADLSAAVAGEDARATGNACAVSLADVEGFSWNP
jgi:hypothetical protein